MTEITFKPEKGTHTTKSTDGHNIQYTINFVEKNNERAVHVNYETKDRLTPQAGTVLFEMGQTKIEQRGVVFNLEGTLEKGENE
ncbi:hypothetical protein [uncultured Marinococcus sp.]|jgi:hypothetical protein|uniref:hypothetical protein n=1 Tax=uncultured Marinococcus sp. TaxID=487012 RepID=UPI00260169C6|nr:hypothetical protein [uncultured Marinococcus sp.]